MNQFSTYTTDFKRRNEMEQRLIHWARNHFQGKKPFGIHEARERLLAVRDELAKNGVRGTVTISEVRVGGTYAGGDWIATREFKLIAAGRKLRSLTVMESYEHGVLKA